MKKYNIRKNLLLVMLVLAAAMLHPAVSDAAKNKKDKKPDLPVVTVGAEETVGKLKEGKSREYLLELDKKTEVEIRFAVKKGKNKKHAKVKYQLYSKKPNKVYEEKLAVRSDKDSAVSYVLPKGKYRILIFGSAGYRYTLQAVDVTKQPEKLAFDQKVYEINRGKSVKIHYEIVKPEAEYVATDSIVWKTSNRKVATVENGKVKAVGSGKCDVTATLLNGKTYKIRIKVLKLTFDEQVYYDDFAVGCTNISSETKRATLTFINRFSKKTVNNVVFAIYQYDKKGKRITKGENHRVKRYMTGTVEPQKYVTYTYNLHQNTRYVRVCVIKVTYEGKKKSKTWQSSHYQKWKKKYNSYYTKKMEKAAKKAAKKKSKKNKSKK